MANLSSFLALGAVQWIYYYTPSSLLSGTFDTIYIGLFQYCFDGECAGWWWWWLLLVVVVVVVVIVVVLELWLYFKLWRLTITFLFFSLSKTSENIFCFDINS